MDSLKTEKIRPPNNDNNGDFPARAPVADPGVILMAIDVPAAPQYSNTKTRTKKPDGQIKWGVEKLLESCARGLVGPSIAQPAIS